MDMKMPDSRGRVLPRWRIILDGLSSVALIGACLVFAVDMLARRYGWPFHDGAIGRTVPAASVGLPSGPITLDGAPLEGSTSARVVLVAFMDFECQYCRASWGTSLRDIRRDYVSTGKIQLAFRQMPLPGHLGGQRAALFAECARREGRFWVMADQLMTGELPAGVNDDAVRIERELGLSAQFSACVVGSAGDGAVQTDLRLARDAGVVSAPTFFVGERVGDAVKVTGRIVGAAPIERFRQEIDKGLRRS